MINEIDTLYKRGRGKILEWVIKIETINNKVNIFMAYGELNGEHTIKYQNNIKGKNIGKVNETTPYEQALIIANGKINTKQREGYKKLSELVEEYPTIMYTHPKEKALDLILPTYNTDISGNEIPMKCQQYYRSKKDFVDKTGKKWDDRKYYYLLNPYADKRNDALIINFPCYIQPKVNGVRAFVKLVNDKVKIFSKKGLEYNLPHIAEWFNSRKDLFGDGDIIYDGELYIPGEHLQNISSAVRAMQLNTTLVKYYMFDIAIEDLSQKERFGLLYSPIMKNTIQQDLNSPVVLVETRSVGDDKRVQELTDIFIKQGYEGSVCRSFDGIYQFGKRPQSIVKLKRTISNEFTITDGIVLDNSGKKTENLFGMDKNGLGTGDWMSKNNSVSDQKTIMDMLANPHTNIKFLSLYLPVYLLFSGCKVTFILPMFVISFKSIQVLCPIGQSR